MVLRNNDVSGLFTFLNPTLYFYPLLYEEGLATKKEVGPIISILYYMLQRPQNQD
jgi:hypothetical protein